MSDRVKENVIEWIEGDKVASFTFSQKRFINRVRKLAEKYGDDVCILRENADGSIFGHIPCLESAFSFRPKIQRS